MAERTCRHGASLDDGIRVVGANPGFVETERMDALLQTRAEQTLGDVARWREVVEQMNLPLCRTRLPTLSGTTHRRASP